MSSPMDAPQELQQLADAFGIETSYEDVYKRRQVATAESLLAALRVLGAEIDSFEDVPAAIAAHREAIARRGIEPVIVAWDGRATDFRLNVPADRTRGKFNLIVTTESGCEVRMTHRNPQPVAKSKRDIELPVGYSALTLQTPALEEHGYHRLIVETSGGRYESCVIAAPSKAYSNGDASNAPDSPEKIWGCFLPLYSLRTERCWGAGDFTDLSDFSDWVRELGGRLVGTLPLLAAFLDEPFDPSPYAPVSRLFWNEAYIDVTCVPELADCQPARDLLADPLFQQTLAELRATEEVDYRRIMQVKRRALEMLAAEFFNRRPQRRFDEFRQFTERRPQVDEYAGFRATVERRGEPWQRWPDRPRAGALQPSDYDEAVANYHRYVQWIADEQIQALARHSEEAGDGLYLDLPLGTRPDGYDVWRNQNVYLAGATAGAPPDSFFTKGQNWGFPPAHPEGIREDGYRHIRKYLAHHMKPARTLRIDHVMGLHRLYCIPEGASAADGVYIRYPAEELYAVVCLESQRHQTTIIGENLGTVPPEVDEGMERHGLRRMFVVQYALYENKKGHPDKNRPLSDIPRECIASLNTHDMPLFAAWWRGLDLPLRRELGLLDDDGVRQERRNLEKKKAELTGWLRSEGWLEEEPADDAEVHAAILRLLAASDAEAVLVNLEDLWLEPRPQNIPGTAQEKPNWRRKASLTFEQFRRRPEVVKVLSEVSRLREKQGAGVADKTSTRKR